MKWMDPAKKREYYAKYKQVEVENGQGWFDVYELPGNVYAICEPQHFEEVNAFLVLGSESALLIDTGMGIADISKLVSELWSGPLEVVNTHFHFDHTGCNYKFPEVWAADDELVRKVAGDGIPGSHFSDYMKEDMFLFDYPDYFRHEDYRIRPYNFKPCEDGHIFDLGSDRKIEFITTPGHTKDHAVLYDHKYKILFTGDMFYLGGIYIMFNTPEFGVSDYDDYINSLEKVLQRCPDAETLYVSHNDFAADAVYLQHLLRALLDIRDGRVEGKPLTNANHTHGEDPRTLIAFNFDGFVVAVHERFLR